jgi:hypothetical protein
LFREPLLSITVLNLHPLAESVNRCLPLLFSPVIRIITSDPFDERISFSKKMLPLALYSSVEMVYFCIMDKKGENMSEPAAKTFRFGLLQVMGIVALVMIVTALLTAWWVKHYIYASKFTPTVLTVKEQKVLDSKLAKLEGTTKKAPVACSRSR